MTLSIQSPPNEERESQKGSDMRIKNKFTASRGELNPIYEEITDDTETKFLNVESELGITSTYD